MPTYPPDILDTLARHGILPTSRTPPTLVRAFLNDLYRFELRRERDLLRAGTTEKAAYLDIVVALRKKYWLLSLQAPAWEEITSPRGAGPHARSR